MNNKNFIITEQNAKEYSNKIGLWIKEKIANVNAKGVVLGMSSGVDCSIVAALCKNANINVHLVIMPYGEDMENSQNMKDALELINKFKFDYHIFNIKPAVDSIKINSQSNNIELAHANIRPRVRMTYLYQYAQINNLLVIGTGNLAEKTVGYFTKWGDGGCDLNPIGMFTKKEVYVLAKFLGVPESIINKKPSANLWEGQTDEQELGLTYNQIDEYILNGTTGKNEVDKKIEQKKLFAKHKIEEIPIFNEK